MSAERERTWFGCHVNHRARVGVLRHRPKGTLAGVAEGESAEELDDLTARLRREAAGLGSRPRSAAPGRPIAKELRVADSDTAEAQRQGVKVAVPGVCNAEGWVLRGLPGGGGYGYGGDMPVSVWCSRPADHDGDHEARIGRGLLHRHEVEVARWSAAP